MEVTENWAMKNEKMALQAQRGQALCWGGQQHYKEVALKLDILEGK